MLTITSGYTSEVSKSSVLEKMQELSDTQEPLPKSESVIVCPAFYGERHNTSLRGQISGMNPSNMSSIGKFSSRSAFPL